MKIKDVLDTENFSVENLDVSEIQNLSRILPRSGVIDSNIAEKHLITTIEAQDLCQEKSILIDKIISIKKILLDKAEAESALIRAKEAGHKTAKEKEWFIQTDEEVLVIKKELETAKVYKLWIENKVKYFSMWHYALKSFLRRDYGIESSSNYSVFSSVPSREEMEELPVSHKRVKPTEDICGEIDWK